MKTRVWILDDHRAIRALLEEFINGLGEFTVVGSTEDIDETRRAMEADWFDLLLLDLDLDGCSGFELLEQVQSMIRRAPVVIISSDVSAATLGKVQRFRIAGYVSKASSLDEMAAALRRVARGETYFSHEVLAAMARQSSPRPIGCEGRSGEASRPWSARADHGDPPRISAAGVLRRCAAFLGQVTAARSRHLVQRALPLSAGSPGGRSNAEAASAGSAPGRPAAGD